MKKKYLLHDRGEFSTTVIFRVGGKYFKAIENGGRRGAHSVNNRFPDWLTEPHEISKEEAYALVP